MDTNFVHVIKERSERTRKLACKHGNGVKEHGHELCPCYIKNVVSVPASLLASMGTE